MFKKQKKKKKKVTISNSYLIFSKKKKKGRKKSVYIPDKFRRQPFFILKILKRWKTTSIVQPCLLILL